MKDEIKCFVSFLSPGSFISEKTTIEIDDWCALKAEKMATEIRERHGAKPYGFYFTTRERKQTDFDSKEIERSGVFHMGGTVLSLAEVKSRDNEKDSILISNMECNEWSHIIENTNSYLHVSILNENDIVLPKSTTLEYKGSI